MRHQLSSEPQSSGGGPIRPEMIGDIQTFVVSLVTLFFEPMLYQAFLQIGANFCYPFGTENHHVPLGAMIKDLEKNLQQMCFVVDSRVHGIKEMPTSPKPKTPRSKQVDEEDDDGD